MAFIDGLKVVTAGTGDAAVERQLGNGNLNER